jgi:hypothetical protein
MLALPTMCRTFCQASEADDLVAFLAHRDVARAHRVDVVRGDAPLERAANVLRRQVAGLGKRQLAAPSAR